MSPSEEQQQQQKMQSTVRGAGGQGCGKTQKMITKSYWKPLVTAAPEMSYLIKVKHESTAGF